MNCKWVIGGGDFLDMAHDAWCRAHPGLEIAKITIPQNTGYEFDLHLLDDLPASEGMAFMAFNERFGNFKRLELMAAAMQRGLKLCSFISPRAMLAGTAQVAPNAFIGDGVILGHGSRIGFNSVLLPGVQIGSHVQLQSSCWLEMGVLVGDHAKVGAHCTLRSGAMIAPKVKVGRGCELGWARRYEKDIAPKTTFDARYDAPIYTYG